MAAPLNFNSPKNLLVFEQSSFSNEKSRHKTVIGDHYFNCAVEVCSPNVAQIPTTVTASLSPSSYYIVRNLPLSRLIDKEFIEAFVRNGAFYAVSLNTRIDVANSVAVLPTGKLVLSVDKDMYETLGLEGRRSIFSQTRERKFVIEVELTKPSFTPGKKNYERTKWCFSERLNLRFDFVFTWVPHDKSICSSSVGKYFSGMGLSVSSCRAQMMSNTMKDVCVPDLLALNILENSQDLFEWLGAVSCYIDSEEEASNDFVSMYTTPSPCNICTQLTHAKWQGFFTPEAIAMVIDEIRLYLKTPDHPPWASVTVHGYADSPVSWRGKEHGYHQGGENIYTYIVFPNDNYWLYMAVGSHDVCP
ncbi:PREDICTED: ribonuclease P protein subunit p40-like [Priapulus caudatus]|uniref:Ribonuclease P protein subunit p40-like n=1 Tax=Priapulus caudatus TaxID=37621 RepID=A0ABM1DUQ0_PRICU|nr:PREDICTED: ribonuclease P protein subunit p40-like [Priapulus caudatus]